jgi:hypothetical protein
MAGLRVHDYGVHDYGPVLAVLEVGTPRKTVQIHVLDGAGFHMCRTKKAADLMERGMELKWCVVCGLIVQLVFAGTEVEGIWSSNKEEVHLRFRKCQYDISKPEKICQLSW